MFEAEKEGKLTFCSIHLFPGLGQKYPSNQRAGPFPSPSSSSTMHQIKGFFFVSWSFVDTRLSAAHMGQLWLCSLLQEMFELVSEESNGDEGFQESKGINKSVDIIHYKDMNIQQICADQLNID